MTSRLTGSGHQRIGLGASALAAILWGFGGIFAVLTSARGLVLTFYLLWIGAALLTIILYSSGRRMTWATMRASWLGGAFLAGDLAMFFSAVKLTSIVDVTVIGALQPVLVLIGARHFFGEKMGRWDVFWILIAMVGVSTAVFGHRVSDHHQVIGDLLAVGALLCWSGYWLATKHASGLHNAVEYTASVAIMAALTVTPIVVLARQSLGHVKAGDWLWIGLLAIVPGSGNLVMNWAHRYVDASVSSAIMCLSPLVAALAALVILGQSLTMVQVGGVVAGLAAIAVVAARHQEPSTSQFSTSTG